MAFIGSIVEFMRNQLILCINPDVDALFVGSNVEGTALGEYDGRAVASIAENI